MTGHRYPPSALVADYARAGLGFAITASLAFFAQIAPVITYILSALAAVFLLYGVRTAIRQQTRIEIGEQGIEAAGPMGASIAWGELTDVQLRYYSTRRDRQDGWMQLGVKGAGRTIKVDSSLDGFDDVVASVVAAAERRGLAFGEPTLENLRSMGLANPAETP